MTQYIIDLYICTNVCSDFQVEELETKIDNCHVFEISALIGVLMKCLVSFHWDSSLIFDSVYYWFM